MIEIKAKIHDKFSIEFKVGFVVKSNVRDNNFMINTWIFVPNSLDINSQTYGKEFFYRDIKSNVRLITPEFAMHDIAGGEAVPLNFLKSALERLVESQTRESIADYEYQIKMYSAIAKSSLRNMTYRIMDGDVREDIEYLCDYYAANAARIISAYREMRRIIDDSPVEADIKNYYSFGDEFMSHILEHYSYRVLKKIDGLPYAAETKELRAKVAEIICNEKRYKYREGYTVISTDKLDNNRYIVFRHSILKKYVESDLYINLNKKQDGRAVQQLYSSLAAGIAMIFATFVAFASQRKFGNLSGSLFISLVISYMFKDRIKELMRYYFAHKLGRKYFDNKATINIKENTIGWLKEGMDFITDSKAPQEVMEIRNRTTLIEAENRISDEKIILYRKLVYIDSEKLMSNNEYKVSGINDIFRLYVNRFTQKMDDPQVPLRLLNDDGTVEIIYTEKIYYLNIVMQFQYDNSLEYKRFRVVMTRNGILEIQHEDNSASR